MVQSGDAAKQFAGPIDGDMQTIHGQGITGMWKGVVGASFIDRSCFAAMFGGQSSFLLSETDNQDSRLSIEF
jgi:hypothetical protein